MSQNPQPQFELAWQSLRPSLEWAKEFGLIFVFGADARGKEALFRRADEVMRGQVRPFERPTVKSAQDYANTLMPILVDQASSQSAAGLPLWLDLDGNPHDPAWNAARTNFLSRLNERRARLVRENTRSVVLVLPGDWTKLAAEAAPDLWTIRQPSVYLQSGVAGVGVAEGQHEAPNMAKISSSEPESPQFSRNQELPSAVRRWQHGALSDASGELTVWDGTLASEAAFDAGYTQLALDIARKTVDLAKTAVEKQGKTPERLRDLSVSMNKLGDVASAFGESASPAASDRRDLDRHHGLPHLRHAALVLWRSRAGHSDQRARQVRRFSRSRHECDPGPHRTLCRARARPCQPGMAIDHRDQAAARTGRAQLARNCDGYLCAGKADGLDAGAFAPEGFAVLSPAHAGGGQFSADCCGYRK